jgi:hypothetical protein
MKAVATDAIERFWQFGGLISANSEIDEPYFRCCVALMLVKIELITSPARIGGSAAMPRKIAVARRQ